MLEVIMARVHLNLNAKDKRNPLVFQTLENNRTGEGVKR